jgi:hypothetical protein
MPAPLPAPHIPLGFPPLAAAGGQTASPGNQTTSGTESGGLTARPGSQTTHGTEAGGSTASLSRQTAH